MILLADEELRNLEKDFGPEVRRMGSWNTDGIFGYSAIPIPVVERAMDGIPDPSLIEALHELEHSGQNERTRRFIDLLYSFGPALVGKMIIAYREYVPVRHPAPRPASAGKTA